MAHSTGKTRLETMEFIVDYFHYQVLSTMTANRCSTTVNVIGFCAGYYVCLCNACPRRLATTAVEANADENKEKKKKEALND